MAEARRRLEAAGPARVPGAYVVTLDAEPVLYVERGGKGLVPLREPSTRTGCGPRSRRWPSASGAGACRASAIERFDGEPVVGSPVGELLVELGFRQGPRRADASSCLEVPEGDTIHYAAARASAPRWSASEIVAIETPQPRHAHGPLAGAARRARPCAPWTRTASTCSSASRAT